MTKLNRRTCLQACGVSLALPWLESLVAREKSSRDGESSPKRMVLICTTLGLHAPSLWPDKSGADYESTEYLDILKDHRSDLTLFSGLCHQNQSGRRPHDSEATWLTAATNPGFAGFRNSISVDQFAADQVGSATRFPSITLSSNNLVSQSYSRSGTMIPATTRPSKLFHDLFLSGGQDEIRRQQQSLQHGRSVLDTLRSETRRLERRISLTDVALLNEYLQAVRETEIKITAQEGWLHKSRPVVDAEIPKDVKNNSDLIGRVNLLMDLIPLIVQTDSSRIITVMIQDHNVVPQIPGVDGNHHNLSHHGQDVEKIRQLRTVESQLLGSFGRLLGKLKSTAEGDGRLLDHTSILCGSNLGNANMHDARNLPILVAGGLRLHGNYVACADGTPLSNLFVTLLNDVGVQTQAFGQSTGRLEW